jgi:hypothetical protein
MAITMIGAASSDPIAMPAALRDDEMAGAMG